MNLEVVLFALVVLVAIYKLLGFNKTLFISILVISVSVFLGAVDLTSIELASAYMPHV